MPQQQDRLGMKDGAQIAPLLEKIPDALGHTTNVKVAAPEDIATPAESNA
jgi:hypothetical protein